MSTRRVFLESLAFASTGLWAAEAFPSRRPPVEKRKFVSEAVEAKIAEVRKAIADPELAWLFENSSRTPWTRQSGSGRSTASRTHSW